MQRELRFKFEDQDIVVSEGKAWETVEIWISGGDGHLTVKADELKKLVDALGAFTDALIHDWKG